LQIESHAEIINAMNKKGGGLVYNNTFESPEMKIFNGGRIQITKVSETSEDLSGETFTAPPCH
jgi:hypothetical protein